MRKLRLMWGSRDGSRGSGHIPAGRTITDKNGPDPSHHLKSQKPAGALGPQVGLLPKGVSASLVSTWHQAQTCCGPKSLSAVKGRKPHPWWGNREVTTLRQEVREGWRCWRRTPVICDNGGWMVLELMAIGWENILIPGQSQLPDLSYFKNHRNKEHKTIAKPPKYLSILNPTLTGGVVGVPQVSQRWTLEHSWPSFPSFLARPNYVCSPFTVCTCHVFILYLLGERVHSVFVGRICSFCISWENVFILYFLGEHPPTTTTPSPPPTSPCHPAPSSPPSHLGCQETAWAKEDAASQFELAQGKAKASVWKLGSSLHAAGGGGLWPPWSRTTPNTLLGQGHPGLRREGGGRAPALCHYLTSTLPWEGGSRPTRAVPAAEGRPRTRLLVAQREKQSACNVGDLGSIPEPGRFPWRRKWQPTPVFLPGKSYGQRSLVGYSLWGCKKSDMTEQLHSQPQGRGHTGSAVPGCVQRGPVVPATRRFPILVSVWEQTVQIQDGWYLILSLNLKVL